MNLINQRFLQIRICLFIYFTKDMYWKTNKESDLMRNSQRANGIEEKTVRMVVTKQPRNFEKIHKHATPEQIVM